MSSRAEPRDPESFSVQKISASLRAREAESLRVRHAQKFVEVMKTRTVGAMKNLESLEPFLAIRTEREYDAAVARLNALVDEVGDNTLLADCDAPGRTPLSGRGFRSARRTPPSQHAANPGARRALWSGCGSFHRCEPQHSSSASGPSFGVIRRRFLRACDWAECGEDSYRDQPCGGGGD